MVWGLEIAAQQLEQPDLREYEEELQEQIGRWATYETLTFCAVGRSMPGGEHPAAVHAVREAVVESLQRILLYHGARSELTSALTLWCAVATKVMRGRCSGTPISELTSDVFLAAVVRLVLKCNNRVPADEAWVFHHVETVLGLSTPSEVEVSRKEDSIIEMMEGRVALPSLPSPVHWALVVMERAAILSSLEIASPVLVNEMMSAVIRNISPWVEFLAVRLVMKEDLTPRSLGLTACILSAVSAGATHATDARPAGVDQLVWESTILAQRGQGAQAEEDLPEGALPIANLAQAACCSAEELRELVFSTVLAVQEVLFHSA